MCGGEKNAFDHKNIHKKTKNKERIAKKWSIQLYSKSSKAIEFIDTSQIRTFVSHRKKESHTGFEKHESEKMIHIFR